MKALLSVYDKTGLIELARELKLMGWDIIASGDTSAALVKADIEHRQVSDVTESPEMLGGRVKTLHPRIHGGILADRSNPAHVEDMERYGIDPIDLVVCNLYPFESNPSVELIDVGGPTMVRAAAKNFAHVGVVTSPSDYQVIIEELREFGSLSKKTRLELAKAAFAHTAKYDLAIVDWLKTQSAHTETTATETTLLPETTATDTTATETTLLPETIQLVLERAETLRYGENPHQSSARYRIAGEHSWWDSVTQYGGKELSYLNIFDADAAWRLVAELSGDADGEPAVAIIKHANPCGAAVAENLVVAYERALDCDPTSAFGGIVAIGGLVDTALATAISAGPQADLIIASSFESEALEQLRSKRKATRILSAPGPEALSRQIRVLGASVLVQDFDSYRSDSSTWRVVTEKAPTQEQWKDMKLAWRIFGRTTSNAIGIVKDGQAVGVGAGQQSRVVAAEIATKKAGDRAKGSAAASDAFFPFPDGLEVLAQAGVVAIVQPGGSIRDNEVIEVANKLDIAMVTTGERHFRH